MPKKTVDGVATTRQERLAFGTRLRALRQQLGLKIRDVAVELADQGHPVSIQAISAWERGEYAPDGPTVRMLESFFGAREGELGILLGYATGPTVEDRLSALEHELGEVRTVAAETLDLVRKLASRRPPPTVQPPRQAAP